MERLTSCEQEIMSVIWIYEGDIPEREIRSELEKKYGKVYARTTVATFLMKMEGKGYLEKYKNGRNSCVHAKISREDFVKAELERMLMEFYDGDTKAFASVAAGTLGTDGTY